jgi:hypothetical protein
VTTTKPSLSEGRSEAPGPGQRRTPRTGAWLPTWDLITTKNLEIRKRRGLMITMVVLIIVPTVLFYGLRLLFHAVDPHTYALAGSPGMFSGATNLMDEFGFIAAAALGAAAGTTDLSDGMFRHLVITGRSRLALYLARIPAGLAILVPLVALAFVMNCLVTSYESPPNPTTASFYGVTVPDNLDQAGLQTFLLQHPQQEINGFLPGVPGGPGITPTPAQIRSAINKNIASYYSDYTAAEISESTPADNEMVKIGLWLELDMAHASSSLVEPYGKLVPGPFGLNRRVRPRPRRSVGRPGCWPAGPRSWRPGAAIPARPGCRGVPAAGTAARPPRRSRPPRR